MSRRLRQPLWLKLWNKSQTKLWGYVQIAGAGILYGIDQIDGVVNDPHFSNILSNMTVPKTVTILLAVLGLVTWMAHGREND